MEARAESDADQAFVADQDIFKPLVLRSFITLDDLEIANREQIAKTTSGLYATPKPTGEGRPTGEMLNLHLTPLSLGQLRLTLFLIDCYLIATRFYNTYVVLREILMGKRLTVDATPYLSILAGLPTQKQVNGETMQKEQKMERYNVFQQETHYQCGHSPIVKSQIVSLT